MGISYGLLDPSQLPGPQLTPSAPPPMPAPQMANMPTVPRPSLMQRIQNILTPTPQGMDGILSDDDITNARHQALLTSGLQMLANSRGQAGVNYGNAPGFGQLIAQGLQTDRGAYGDALNSTMQLRQNALALKHAQALEMLRQTEAGKPVPLNETPDQRIERVMNASLDYANAGDPDTAGKLASLATALRQARGGLNRYQAVQAGDQVYTFDPANGTYTPGPARGVPAAKLQEDADNRRIREMQIEALQAEHDQTISKGLTQNFMSQNQKLADTEQTYQTAKSAFAEARAGNPAALTSAILAFASNADPKAQLRSGVINLVMQVDKSIKGRFDLAMQRLSSGTLPPYIINDMEQLVNKVHAGNAAIYERRRAAMTSMHPELDSWIPRTNDIFDLGDTPGATTPTAGAPGNSAGVRQYLKP